MASCSTSRAILSRLGRTSGAAKASVFSAVALAQEEELSGHG
jgi:hypothetical protein